MSVMDSVDKYRHGVLIGNFVEDQFGKDLEQKGASIDPKKLTTSKDHHDLNHSLYQPHPIISQKQPVSNTFYQTSKVVAQSSYKRPEQQTSYHIFHRQQVTPTIPILQNQPKKEERFAIQGKLYNDTRYHLSNKFGEKNSNGFGMRTGSGYQNFSQGQNQYKGNNNEENKQSLRQTGNIYDIDGQQIPDILTGQIFRHAPQRPSNQLNQTSKNFNEPTTKITGSVIAKSINPYGTSNAVKPQVSKFDEQMYRKYVLPNEKGQEHDILFGHGIEINEFHRRQLATTYDLSYNQQVKPQTQINSFYNVNPVESAKKFHRETFYEKNHQNRIPEFGTKTVLGQEKLERPYVPYTRSLDQEHLKDEYLRR